MSSIEEEMSRFEEEIMTLTQDAAPIRGAASKEESSKRPGPGFQPRQTQLGAKGGVPRAPGFQPRQTARPGGNMPHRPHRPPGPHGFVPHQVRGNHRFQGPPRFPHLPPPPPMPPSAPMGPMHNMGPHHPPHPGMMGGHMGPLPPPPMPPPFAMMPPGPPPMHAPPPSKPVTVSAKPTTYASKPVLNKKKKKLKKEKAAESKEEEKEAKPVLESPVVIPPSAPNPAASHLAVPHHPAPPQMNMMLPSHSSQDTRLPPPPPVPQSFIPAPAPPMDLHQGGASYELPTASEPPKKKEKKKKFVRIAAGLTWEDDSLTEWDPNDFRLFAGDLGNEVTEDTLIKVFGSYPSYLKCKIVRDKRTNKTKGYGFVSFKDPRDFVQAIKDWNGKYVGNRPIKLLKSTWKDRDVNQVRKKQKEKDRLGLR